MSTDVLVFAYDRRALRRLEWLFAIRSGSQEAGVTVRFINENRLDSSSHGGVEVRRIPGGYEIIFRFSCLGAAVWRQTQSFSIVQGMPGYMEGRDSRNRAVRMSCLGLVRLATAAPRYTDLMQIVHNLVNINGLRRFMAQINLLGRFPQVPTRVEHGVAIADGAEIQDVASRVAITEAEQEDVASEVAITEAEPEDVAIGVAIAIREAEPEDIASGVAITEATELEPHVEDHWLHISVDHDFLWVAV